MKHLFGCNNIQDFTLKMNAEYPFEILIKTVKTIRNLKHLAGYDNQTIPSVSVYITDNPTYLGIVLNNWERCYIW